MKNKKEYPIVNATWVDVTDPEYDLDGMKCPNKKCKATFGLYDMDLKYSMNICECEKVNRIVMCPHCKTKFRLKVKAL